MVDEKRYACWDCVCLITTASSHKEAEHSSEFFGPTVLTRKKFLSLIDEHQEIFFNHYFDEVKRDEW